MHSHLFSLVNHVEFQMDYILYHYYKRLQYDLHKPLQCRFSRLVVSWIRCCVLQAIRHNLPDETPSEPVDNKRVHCVANPLNHGTNRLIDHAFFIDTRLITELYGIVAVPV